MFLAALISRRAGEIASNKNLTVPFLKGLGLGLVLAWPGGVFRGGYLVSYGIFAFETIFRRSDYFGQDPIQTVLLRPFHGSPFELAVYAGLLLVSLLILWRGKIQFGLLTFLIYSLATLIQGIGNSFENGTYAAEFLIPLSVSTAIALHQASLRIPQRKNILILTAGILFAVVACQWPSRIRTFLDGQSRVASRVSAVMADVSRTVPKGRSILVSNYASEIKAYLPGYVIERTLHRDSMDVSPAFHASSYCSLVDVDALRSDARAQLPLMGDEYYTQGFSLSCPNADGP
jgi:hypothetical protein